MDNAEAELKRRRERAKISQRAFRVRQATTLRDLREENARLKRVIKDVVEASKSDDLTALRSTIHKVAEAAGFVAELSHRSDSGPGSGSDSPSGYRSLAHSDITSAAASLPSGLSWDLMPSVVEEATATKDMNSVIPHDSGPQQSSPMGFRLDCGILAFPSGLGRILDPPLDIAPYLGPNQHTLAARIYWYCTETTVSLLYQLTGHQPGRIASVAQSNPILAGMLRYVSTQCSYNYLLALAEARLEFYRVGSCKADNLAATMDSALLLRQRVEKEHDVGGLDFDEWSTATAVARGAEGRLQGPALRRLEAAMRNDGTDADARNILEAFIHSFWLKATCFGDGPRWKASYIKERTAWLAQALS
ncbi:hypothetical protein F5883DRAFT_593636 [Diaporthe sp. PMI_573]|nr:hypothetical protein F5883DRAFT_593636 [Diaporthaceae sp. PMI_573]